MKYLSRTAQQKLIASIAILAVLLLFVAPMVSKNLLLDNVSHQDNMSESMPMMSMEDGHDAQSMHHAMMMSMPGMDMHQASEDGAVCGYCELLIHVPLLCWIFIPFIWLMLLVSRAPPVKRRTVPVVRHCYPRRLTRAPPQFC